MAGWNGKIKIIQVGQLTNLDRLKVNEISRILNGQAKILCDVVKRLASLVDICILQKMIDSFFG